MKLNDIEKHWQDWAKKFGQDIRATEKSKTRKALEVDALRRGILAAGFKTDDVFSILEAGSGTGHNCIALSEAFPNALIEGFDYVKEMISNANSLKKKLNLKNIKYSCENLLKLNESQIIKKKFDIVFTNRCLINLNTHDLQKVAINNLSKLVSENGIMILAENPQKKFDYQNQLRGFLGLPKRSQPEFNLLIDENNYIQTAKENGFELIYNDDFSSLHDLLLYVLIPSINGGKIDYDHPILKSATNLSLKIFQNERNAFSNFGQNRLYYFARKNTS